MKNLEQIKEFRHTIKVYDENKEIPQDKWNQLMEFLRWTPHSFNFQVVRAISVDLKSDFRKEILESGAMMHNEMILKTAPKIVYFVVPKNGTIATPENEYIYEGTRYAAFQRAKRVAEVTDEEIKATAPNILAAWNSMGFSDIGLWGTRQAYIYLGYLTMSAASQGIDTTSMEGFIPEKLNALFLEKGLITEKEQVIVAVGVGYRKDETVFNPSERKPMEKFLKEV